MGEYGNNDDVCANCGRFYTQHLLHDGNKCSTGSITGWFPKRLAASLGTMKPKEFSTKPLCGRVIPGSYKFSRGLANCDLPFDHGGPCNPKWKADSQEKQDQRFDDYAKHESGHRDI